MREVWGASDRARSVVALARVPVSLGPCMRSSVVDQPLGVLGRLEKVSSSVCGFLPHLSQWMALKVLYRRFLNVSTSPFFVPLS